MVSIVKKSFISKCFINLVPSKMKLLKEIFDAGGTAKKLRFFSTKSYDVVVTVYVTLICQGTTIFSIL